MSRGPWVVLLLWMGCGSSPAPTETTPATAAAPVAPTPASDEPAPEPVDPVDMTCDALADAAVATLELDLDQIRESDVEVAQEIWGSLVDPFGECLDAGEGAWIAVPLALRVDGEREGTRHQTFGIDFTLSYVAPDGTEHRPAEGQQLHHQIDDQIPEGQSLKVFDPQDVDGDGVGELAFVVASFGPDYGETADGILQFRDGEVGALDGFGDFRVRDQDDDGRFDVLISRPWRCRFSNDMEGTTYESGCPWVMMHGTEEGFSTTDAAAEAYLREQCRRRPTTLISESPEDYCWPTRGFDAQQIACARVWGASVEDVQAQVRREYPRQVSRECRSDEDLAALLAHAEHEPPLTLE